MPAAAVAAALTVGASVAPAASHNHQGHRDQQEKRDKRPERAKSHVALHLSNHDLLAGNGIKVSGKVRPGGRHRVRVVFRGPEAGRRGVVTKANGSFAVRWQPQRIGGYSVRAYGIHDRHTRGSASEQRHLTSYRLAGASWYGPGLWGNGVACGGTLLPGTLGVANKTLPCGTKVRLRYHGHELTVPVIDRGPYVAGREFDLTYAVKQKLGFPGVGTVMASR
ncbi:MAG TPA: septal ring lytic transglycosylase RlpA family protein [Solirubrobacterales bacterium]|nr:septal ring lytic transglycosylase RlpA family protein [Solirubrobacterales bacterium]